MSNKSITKVIILTISVLIFWIFDVLYLTEFITNNKAIQLLISMLSFPVLLIVTIFIMLKIWENDKS